MDLYFIFINNTADTITLFAESRYIFTLFLSETVIYYYFISL